MLRYHLLCYVSAWPCFRITCHSSSAGQDCDLKCGNSYFNLSKGSEYFFTPDDFTPLQWQWQCWLLQCRWYNLQWNVRNSIRWLYCAFKRAGPAKEKENIIFFIIIIICSFTLQLQFKCFTFSRTGLTTELSFKIIKHKGNSAGLSV